MKKRTLRRLKNGALALGAGLSLLALGPVSGAHGLLTSVTHAGELTPKMTHNTAEMPAVSALFYDEKTQGENLLSAVIEHINAAEETIDMVMYSYEHPLVHAALNQAVARGVAVRVVTDGKALAKTKARLRGARYPIVAPPAKPEAHMHHKYLLIDRKTALLGSLNMTQLQVKHDPSMLLISEDSAWVEVLQSETERLLRNRAGRAKFRSGKYAPYAAKTQSESDEMELWLSPGVKRNSVKKRLLEGIKSAEKSLEIVVWQWTDRDLAKAVLARAEAGVRVRIIADDRYLWAENSALRYLWERAPEAAKANISVTSDLGATLAYRHQNPQEPYFNPYVHEHTLIVDETWVASGTANWSFRGFFRNDEATILTDYRPVVRAFLAAFNAKETALRGLEMTTAEALIYPITPDVEAYPEPCNAACDARFPRQKVSRLNGRVVGGRTLMP